jgi:hypothetical protein
MARKLSLLETTTARKRDQQIAKRLTHGLVSHRQLLLEKHRNKIPSTEKARLA